MRLTRLIPKPTYYVEALDGEFADWAFNEERAKATKGRWRQLAFDSPGSYPVDLEIGTGNGYHFSHRAQEFTHRGLLGMELKFKPLIQSIRRAVRAGCSNARIMRYDARFVQNVLAKNEIDNVYLHFPDPWTKRRQTKNRLIQPDFLRDLYQIQKPGRLLEFKTDNAEYFEAALRVFEKSPYSVVELSRDLQNSQLAHKNYITHFETIFMRQDIPINYLLLGT